MNSLPVRKFIPPFSYPLQRRSCNNVPRIPMPICRGRYLPTAEYPEQQHPEKPSG
jgi:hypothetical protein